jgi:hypothetical protein
VPQARPAGQVFGQLTIWPQLLSVAPQALPAHTAVLLGMHGGAPRSAPGQPSLQVIGWPQLSSVAPHLPLHDAIGSGTQHVPLTHMAPLGQAPLQQSLAGMHVPLQAR